MRAGPVGGGGMRGWLPAAILGAAAGIVGGFVFLRSRDSESSDLDVVELQERLRPLSGGRGVGIRIMADGIVELVGDVPSEAAARALLEEVRRAPGVEVVVNRLWTPSSSEGARSRGG